MSKKLITGIILGAAAGTLLLMFLQTEKGKELMSDVKDAAGDVEEKFKNKMKNFDQEVSDLLRKGKQFVKDLEGKTKEATS